MKKVRLLLFVFLIALCGCSLRGDYAVETLKGWTFQYDEGVGCYSVFFGFLDRNDRSVAANADVDIRIVNDDGEEVYRGTKSVSTDDFADYTSEAAGTRYLARIRIPEEEVMPGTTSGGKVYLTVYNEDVFSFDEVNCEAFYCLPLKDVQISFDAFPVELDVKDYFGNRQSTIEIDEASYEFDKDILPQLKITLRGTKTYAAVNSMYTSAYDMISYQLLDSDGYLVDSGEVFLNGLKAGDKFKDDSIRFYDVIPGESYTLKFMEYDR